MASGDSFITFVVNPSFQVFDGSRLVIYVRKDLVKSSNWNDATSCMVGGVAKPCTLDTNTTWTNITIQSGTSENLFPQSTAVTVQINNIHFLKASSHSKHLYHFFYVLKVSQSTTAAQRSQLLVPTVIP